MKYLSSYELSKLSSSELVKYRKKLNVEIDPLVEAVYAWYGASAALTQAMHDMMIELEISAIEAEEDRINTTFADGSKEYLQ